MSDIATSERGKDECELIISVYREDYALLLGRLSSYPYRFHGLEEDLLQEAIEKLLMLAGQGRLNLMGKAHCRNTLLKIARNMGVDLIRKEAKTPILPYEEDMTESINQNDTPPSLYSSHCVLPEEEVLRTEEMAVVSSVLSEVGEEDKELLMLREEIGVPWRDIAELRGQPEEMLRVRYSRLKIRLRRTLRERITI